MDHAEQEFFYVAAPRSDGGQPGLHKAIYGKIFMCKEDSQAFCRAKSIEVGFQFAIFRAIARWPGEGE